MLGLDYSENMPGVLFLEPYIIPVANYVTLQKYWRLLTWFNFNPSMDK